MVKYIAAVGLDYDDGHGGEVRVEVNGEVPEEAIKRAPWLVDLGYVGILDVMPPDFSERNMKALKQPPSAWRPTTAAALREEVMPSGN